jgi:hypothetical protein
MLNTSKKEYSPLVQGGVTVSDQNYTSEKGSIHHFHVIKHDHDGLTGSKGMSREVSFHVIPDTTMKSSRTLANQIKENEFAAANGLLQPEKTINFFESFALISNNISGPAMMGLPHLFHIAGVVPVVVAIVLVFFASSLVLPLIPFFSHQHLHLYTSHGHAFVIPVIHTSHCIISFYTRWGP